MTGAVEVMVVDVQCVMPSLAQVVKCFHTELVSTSEIAQSMGAEQMTFDAKDGYEQASQLDPQGDRQLRAPRQVSASTFRKSRWKWWQASPTRPIFHMLGGHFRKTFRPLNDAIIDGRIRGVVGVVGCTNPKIQSNSAHVKLDRGTDQAQRTGAFDRLFRHCLRSSWTADSGSCAGKGGRKPARGLRCGRHSSRAAYGLLRG